MAVVGTRGRGEVPPTANLDAPDAALPTDVCDFVRVGDEPRRHVRAALSNSFGFGGVNCALLFAAAPPRGAGERGLAD